jgi:hypothetical protein
MRVRLSSLWTWLLVSSSFSSLTSRRPRVRRRTPQVRLGLEVLEDRSVPSVVTVTSASDDPTDTGSLRYALNNATSGEIIDFAAGVRTIDLSSTLNIGVDVAITNDRGAGPVTIDGGGQFTVFTILASSVTASLSGLTIADGKETSSFGGGGIANDGTLTVSDSAFINNVSISSNSGGGIANYGTLTVSNCTFSGNSTFSSSAGGNGIGGGGIANYGALTVSNSTFSGNSSATNSGGGAIPGFSGGGAILNGGALAVSNSTFANNSASTGNYGGGILNYGTGELLVSNSTFFDNSASGAYEGGGGIGGSGGGIANDGVLTVSNSTFSGNFADGRGGGIFNYGTFSNASASFSHQSRLVVSNSTFSGNSVFTGSGSGGGGGIYAGPYPSAVILNGNIISGNVNTNPPTAPDDVAGLVGLSSSNNLIGAGGSGGLSNGVNGNQVGVSIANVGLGLLGSNGGPTQTFAIGPGSFALGRGVTETTAATDQRGVARPINQPSDVGAYQYSATPTVTTSPTSQATIVGQDTSFSAAVSDGTPTPTIVQWQISTDNGNRFTNLSNDSVYSGVASTMLTITSAPATLSGDQYRAVFSNAAGLDVTTAAATLTVQSPASIVPFLGAWQSATVANTFGPLEAFVTDSFGNPVSGASVTFAAVAGPNGATGSFAGNTTVTTNRHGVAIAPALTAGQTAGTFTVTASLSGVASAAVFNLTATPGLPATVTAAAGTPQNTPIGSAYGSLLQAKVVDAFGNPLANVLVNFAAPLAGPSGTFNALTVVPTNTLGIATAPGFSANHVQGTFTVTATAAGIASPANFSLANTAIPAAIRTVSGTGQHATVFTSYGAALTARVTDASGKPVIGITVVFELPGSAANGTFAASPASVTNANGVATAPTLTANTVAGNFTVNAWVAGVAVPAPFTLTNNAGQPAGVSIVAGNSQSAVVAKTYKNTLQVGVVDQFGNPAAGVRVTFTAPNSGAGGTFAGKLTATAATNASGVAIAPAFTANAHPGGFQVIASISGANTSFSLTNLVGPAAKIVAVNKTTPQTTTPGSAFAVNLGVGVTDSVGNDVPGVLVTFTIRANATNGASGTFGGSSTATATTDAVGVATAPQLTAKAKKGSFTVVASIAGLTQTAMFTLTIA